MPAVLTPPEPLVQPVEDVDDIEPPFEEDGDDHGGDGPIRWVTVATFLSLGQAHIARAKLQSEQIDCVLLDDSLSWLSSMSGGGIKLQVPESEAPRAAAVLNDRDSNIERRSGPVLDYAEEPASHHLRTNVCPHCGQRLGETVSVLRRLGAVSVPLSIAAVLAPAAPGVSLLVAAIACLTLSLPRYRCPDCGKQWASPAVEVEQ